MLCITGFFMKKLFFFFAALLLLNSCCIRFRGYAQSDRFDTHRTGILDCVPCSQLVNKPEHHLWIEGYGVSGNASAGMELGYNFNQLRLYGSAGFSWWPSPVPKTTISGQIGMVGFSPNQIFRPEAGMGLGEWFLTNPDKSGKLHPAAGFPIAEKGNYPFWNAYAGLRITVPYSNISLSMRIYRLSAFGKVNHTSFVPGLTCGFRF